nr:immunoglobulin light chain junction region [Macaca mulatta]MOV72706.1 immunoglobulin light chain junction region [Macaca mulatta]
DYYCQVWDSRTKYIF